MLLQTLAKWKGNKDHKGIDPTHLKVKESASLLEKNTQLQAALKAEDYDLALHKFNLLSQESHSSHPVYTRSYDYLLFKWKEYTTLCKHTTQINISPILELLQTLVRVNRVNMRTFNTAMAICTEQDAFSCGLEVVQLIKLSGRQPNMFAYTNLITMCARLGSKHRKRQSYFIAHGERFWHEMTVLHGIKPTIKTVNAMLFLYRTTRGRSHDAIKLLEQCMNQYKVHPDTSTISTLLLCLLKEQHTGQQAAKWLEYALRHNIYIERSLVNAVLDTCRQQCQWDAVESIVIAINECGSSIPIERSHTFREILRKSRDRDAVSTIPTSGKTTLLCKSKPMEETRGELKQKKQKLGNLIRVLETSDVRAQQLMLAQVTKDEWQSYFQPKYVQDLDRLMHTRVMLKSNVHGLFDDVSRHYLYLKYMRLLIKTGRLWDAMDTLQDLLERQVTAVDQPLVCITGCNQVLSACSKAGGRLHEASQVVDWMDKAGIERNRKSFEYLLQCCVPTGAVDIVLSTLKEMQYHGVQPTIHNINIVLKTISTRVQLELQGRTTTESHIGDPIDLSELTLLACRLMKDYVFQNGLKPDEATYFHLFRTFLGVANAGTDVNVRLDTDITLSSYIRAVSLNEDMVGLISTRILNVAIDFFERRQDIDKCFEIYNAMVITHKLIPTSETIELLFSACSQVNEESETPEYMGMAFLDHLLQDSVIARGDHERTARIKSESLKWAARMDMINRSFSKSQQSIVDQVIVKFQDFKLLPLCTTKSRLDVSIYEDIIGVYGQLGYVRGAREYASKMRADHGKVSLNAWNRVLQACSIAAPVVTMQILKDMDQQPDIVSYNTVLNALRRWALVHEDESDDEELECVEEVKPRRNAFATSMLKHDMATVLTDLLHQMQHTHHLQPNALTYSNIISICHNRDEHQEVIKYFDILLADPHVTQLLSLSVLSHYLDACVHFHETTRIQQLQQHLAEWYRPTKGRRQYHLPKGIILKLLHALDAVQDWQTALVMIKQMKSLYGLSPSVACFRIVMATCNRAEKYHYVEPIFLTMQSRSGDGNDSERGYGVFPTAECYVEAIYALEQQEKWTRATELFVEMKRRCPNDEIVPSLMEKIVLGRYDLKRQIM